MLSRRTLPVLIGICLLSGMFLMGQDTWGPEPPILTRTLPDTGITKCYDNTQEIPCPPLGDPFAGQDAQFIISPMNYTDNGNATITDNVTGLVWQKCSAGLSGTDCTVGTGETRNWTDAIAYCEGLNLAGHTDWRLPDRCEYQSILDYGRYNHAIDPVFFPNAFADYWSSSYNTSSPYPGNAGMVHVYSGYVHHRGKAYMYYVRCVRGEQVLPSFTDNGNGTVTDNVTGRIWQQQDDGIGRTWQDALEYCQDLVLAGYSDWRLPNEKELYSIVDDTYYGPAIDPTFFPGTTAGDFWSSSTTASHITHAWYVSFNTGIYTTFFRKTGWPSGWVANARCVRGRVPVE